MAGRDRLEIVDDVAETLIERLNRCGRIVDPGRERPYRDIDELSAKKCFASPSSAAGLRCRSRQVVMPMARQLEAEEVRHLHSRSVFPHVHPLGFSPYPAT